MFDCGDLAVFAGDLIGLKEYPLARKYSTFAQILILKLYFVIMKKIFTLSFIVVLFSCAGNKGDQIIHVSFPNPSEKVISWLDIFPDAEMIRLTGEQLPVLNPQGYLIVHDNMYYVIDPYHTSKIYRFNQNGRYMNSIGSRGRGPNEYLYLTDVMVDNYGNVAIFSTGTNALLTYSPDGLLLERKEFPYSPERFASLNGFNYHYMGIVGAGMDYRLYVTDNSGETIGTLLPAPKSPARPNAQTFSLYGNTLNVCPPEGSEIYQLKDGKMEVTYRFDFGAHNIPDEYYTYSTFNELSIFFTKGIAWKNAFYENKHCAILWIVIEAPTEFRLIYGVLNKQKNVWKWFNGSEGDFIFLQYLDEEYAYLTASPQEMKQVPGMVERFPLLNTLTDDDDIVILKCKTASVKL